MTEVLPARTTRRYFTSDWPAYWNVNWHIVPAAQGSCQPPLLSWTLRAERQAPGLRRYYLEVENLCTNNVQFEWRYEVLGQNGNGKGAHNDGSFDALPADPPQPQADDGWATASDIGGPPEWLLSEPQQPTSGRGSSFVDTGSPAVSLDPTEVPIQDQPDLESDGSTAQDDNYVP